MRIRTAVALSTATLALVGCQGLENALSAHSDVVVHTPSRDLTVTRLASLLGNAKVPVPITKDNGVILANLWSSYQRLAYAAANNDTMSDKIDIAVTPIVNNQRVGMYIDSLRAHIHVDSATEAIYNSGGGGLLDARHILFAYPENATPAQKDSVRKVAEAARAGINAGNFQAMAKKYSKDPGSAAQGGALGVFPKEKMVREFSTAAAALKPGEISGLVESQFGLHIIQRLTWQEAKAEFMPAYADASMQSGDSTLSEGMAKSADLQVKPDSATIATIKAAVANVAEHKDDHTVVATFNRGGKFTVEDLLNEISILPQDQADQIRQGLPPAPDTVVRMFTKSMALRAVMLRSADSAKLDVPAAQKQQLREQFRNLVVDTWKQLGVSPDQLADSAKTTADREKLAANRIDAFVDKFMANEGAPANVPLPLEQVVDSKYKSSVNTSAIDKAIQAGLKIRATADSAQSLHEPASSSVPLPGAGGPPPMPPSGGAPPGSTKKGGG